MISEEIESIIRRVICKHIDPRESFIFLFGSRAWGQAHVRSDYDIGIYKGEKIPLAVIARIKEELEDYPIPVDIDIVDFSNASDAFKKLSLKQVKIWNKPEKNLKLI